MRRRSVSVSFASCKRASASSLFAEANSALRKFADAYSDLSRYLELHSAQVDDERARQVASLRARFETDREIARNETLRHQLELTQERTQRQRTQLRLVVAAISASGVVIALLSYMLIANVRYRKRLIQIADQSGLPRDTAVKGYEIQRALADELQKLRADPNLSKEQRQAAVKDIRTQTEEALKQAVGSHS